MNTNPIKFQDLKIDVKYTVVSYKPVNTKFGKSYILEIVEDGTNNRIKIWSSNKINEYIKTENKSEKFGFMVRLIERGKFEGKKYAEIEGFNDDDGFIDLK